MEITIKGEPEEIAALALSILDEVDGLIGCVVSREQTHVDLEELDIQPLDQRQATARENILAATANRIIHQADPIALISELRKRAGVCEIKVSDEHPYQIVAGDECKSDLGPATILVINGK